MKYNFDRLIDRTGTDSVKYDMMSLLFGRSDLTPMWVADMDFEVPEFIREAIISRAKHPVYGYTFRPKRFFEVVARWLDRRHDWTVDPEHIGFSPGIVPALNMATLAYTDPGDRILVQPPVYFPFFTAVEHHKRQLVYNQLREESGRYAIDFEDLEARFKEGVKMMFLCHPHNPVGRAWTKDELMRLANLCVKYQVIVVSDEIHSDLMLFGHSHIPLASLGSDIAKLTVTCVAPSKTFNLAGLHSSAVIIEDPGLKKRFDTVLDHLHIGGGNLFGQVAMEAAYEHGDEWLKALLKYLEENFSLLKEILERELPAALLSPLEATYLAWLGLKELAMDDKQIMQLLAEEARIAPVDGPRFGPGGESFIRLNIAMPRAELEKACRRMTSTLNSVLSKK